MIESLKDHSVVGAACGKNHTLILTGKCLGFGCLTGMGSVIYEFHKTGLLSRLAVFLSVYPFCRLGLVCVQIFISISLVIPCPMLMFQVSMWKILLVVFFKSSHTFERCASLPL